MEMVSVDSSFQNLVLKEKEAIRALKYFITRQGLLS